MNYEHVRHEFDPVFDAFSERFILGSFPSVKSREQQFYYGHKQNRFWRVLAALHDEPVPEDVPQKKAFLLRNHIAVWDVISECDVLGSSDSSIRNVVAADISTLLAQTKIHTIYTNGTMAYKLYQKYCLPVTRMEAVLLPSTSPANAAYSFERLVCEWERKWKASG